MWGRAEAAVETREGGERGNQERALDLVFGANRPTSASGDGFRR